MARSNKGKALKVSKGTRAAAMLAVDAVVRRLKDDIGFWIDPGAGSHRKFKAACVDDVAAILDGKVVSDDQ